MNKSLMPATTLADHKLWLNTLPVPSAVVVSSNQDLVDGTVFRDLVINVACSKVIDCSRTIFIEYLLLLEADSVF